MTKELNTFSPAFRVELVDCPKKNAFPSRKGMPVSVNMTDGNLVEYVYAADGTRLKATHVTKKSRDKYYRREKYYRGKMIFDDILTRLPRTVLVPGGYYFYESADDAFFLSLYVQDYQGNNRAELYEGNNVFEQTHYYPYGGIIGDLSSAFSQTLFVSPLKIN